MAAASGTTTSAVSDAGRWPPGTVLANRYRISGVLGRGGMGEVYRAFDIVLGQDVALKFLPANTASGPALERFRTEVRLARQVSHPNVCRVYDIGEAEGATFLSMEYVDGEDLASLLRRIGRLPSDKALDIARRLCAGLAAAHEKGVLHRDLKPGNIMLDGRGEVRITDFGLAAIAGSVSGAEARQGTPAYMAPEQLAGREASVRSDIWALGLVLYEMLTGKRAFEARSVVELERMQQETAPASLTAVVRDVDPATERAILRCLAPDPKHRPASAKAVALALPGGDPLAAAIAAGETPSPEMVACSEETEGLRPWAGVTVFAAAVAGVVALLLVSQSASLLNRTPSEYSPEALAAMAREHARRLGYPQRPGESAIGLEANNGYLGYVRGHFTPAQFAAQLGAGRPSPLTFYYRQSPGILDPGADQGWVDMDHPASDRSGMYRMRLDLQGRLLFFEAVPKQLDPGAGTPAKADWEPFFAAAGLDSSKFLSGPPQWVPGVPFDARVAWTGALPDAPGIPIRVEAAGWQGKPISFRVIEPWTQPERDQAPPVQWTNLFWVGLEWFLAFPIACFLARRNLQANRGDRTGAARLGIAVLALIFAGDLLQGSHTAGGAEAMRLLFGFAIDLAWAVYVTVLYLALEPFVRRRYPRLLISWTRLLQGHWRDPLLASNILAGVAAGLWVMLLWPAGDLLKLKLGIAPILGLIGWNDLTGARQFVGEFFLSSAGWPVIWTLIDVFVFFLLRLGLRRDLPAAIAMAVLGVAIAFPNSTYAPIDGTFLAVEWGLAMFMLLRFGIPAMVAYFVIWTAPWMIFTLDPSRWYFSYSLAYLAALLALAGVAFRFALGKRRLLREETLG
jgi:serine/threonine-protein kinase